ncbi:hypothetical protein GGF32_008575 [Allomyces javanicus]|nr:hypothetical protein GGF32_008575 [Allomyces javanicus]
MKPAAPAPTTTKPAPTAAPVASSATPRAPSPAQNNDDDEEEDDMDLDKGAAAVFLRRHIVHTPSAYTSMHGQRLTLVQFILATLDVMGHLDKEVDTETKVALVKWVYSLQHPHGGFVGSDHIPEADLASTYSALVCLVILGDTLSAVNRKTMAKWMHRLQSATTGGYRQYESQPEDLTDLRFGYCAMVTHKLLGIPLAPAAREAAIEYIVAKQTYEGGFGLKPSSEAHGGYTYCAVAALALLDALDRIRDRSALIHWAVARQELGYSGRIGKPNDTCYSFWIGASLAMLDALDLIDPDKNALFLCSQRTLFGGLSKDATSPPDLLHTYMGIAGMALQQHLLPAMAAKVQLADLDVVTNISVRALRHLHAAGGPDVLKDEQHAAAAIEVAE